MLSEAQKLVLRTFIENDPILQPQTVGETTDLVAVLGALNAASDTDAWKSGVTDTQISDAPDYTDYGTQDAAMREAWVLFLSSPRDFTRAGTRAWVKSIWGNAVTGSSAAAVLQAATEKASVAEAALGGDLGIVDDVSALVRSWIGQVSLNELRWILYE